MSLKDRLAGAQGASVGSPDEDALFSMLLSKVNDQISAHVLDALAQSNRRGAENEIRSICRVVFSSADWLNVEAGIKDALVDRLLESVFGFGPLSSLLADESVTEVMVNGPQRIYYEREGRIFLSEDRFADDQQLRGLIDRILGPLGRRIDESSPLVNARLPKGHRVHAAIEPVALDGPYLTIRKFSEEALTLQEMECRGCVGEGVLQFLAWAVRTRKNIAVSGGTGSGKTTLLNALSGFISPGERVITVEDSAELRLSSEAHVVRLEARPVNAEGFGEITIRELVINALRMRPDRIVVGECRGGEALDMLQAMNTGHDGSLTTLHANSPAEVPQRLVTMVRYVSEIPVEVVESYVASALHLVVQTARDINGFRFISELAEFNYDRTQKCCVVRTLYRRTYQGDPGVWLGEPWWLPEELQRGSLSEEEVEAWRQQVCLREQQ